MLALAVAVTGCGGQQHDGARTLRAADAAASLRAGHWHVQAVTGMPHTVSGAPQAAYLQTTSPTGVQIDLQFFTSDPQAQAEAAAAQAKLRGFHATAIGNVIAFSRGSGRQRLTDADLKTLRAALR